MEKYFNIIYEFNIDRINKCIESRITKKEPGYICVADGVVLDLVNRNTEYYKVVNKSIFSICDSSWVPLYIKWIYGRERKQYCGAQIFEDIVKSHKYRMIFLGTSQEILAGLRSELSRMNPAVNDMSFYALPFCPVEDFDYNSIATMISTDGADIIWIALGAPKQDYFMNKLLPHLKKGIMLGVGAAFKFYSGIEERRAPNWMVINHLEFLYRIYRDPKKQLKRCFRIVITMPTLLWQEYKRKKTNTNNTADNIL